MQKTWTPEKITLLKKLADEGLSGAKIASKIGGITRCAVIGKANRMRIKLIGNAKKPTRKPDNTKWSEGEIEKLRVMWDDLSIPIKFAASSIGRTPGAISAKAAHLGLKSRRSVTVVKVKRFAAPVHSAAIPPEEKATGISIIDMNRNQCRFAISPHTAKPNEHEFCGKDVINGSAYCVYHHEITHRPPNAFEEKVAKC